MPRILVVSGEIGIGKTTACQRLLAGARQRRLDAAGIVSPPRLVDGQKIGIDLLDVRTGDIRSLADVVTPGTLDMATPASGPATEHWQFYQESIAWAAAVLRDAAPCDLLLVDELGPLELLRSQGWIDAVDVLNAGVYQLAVVVVRPALLGRFRELVPAADPQPLIVTADNRQAIPDRLLAALGGM